MSSIRHSSNTRYQPACGDVIKVTRHVSRVGCRVVSTRVSKTVKSDYSFPSVFRVQLGSRWTEFHDIWYLSIFRKTCPENSSFLKTGQKLQVPHTKTNIYFWYLSIFRKTCPENSSFLKTGQKLQVPHTKTNIYFWYLSIFRKTCPENSSFLKTGQILQVPHTKTNIYFWPHHDQLILQ